LPNFCRTWATHIGMKPKTLPTSCFWVDFY
jgi:hypothetical protein